VFEQTVVRRKSAEKQSLKFCPRLISRAEKLSNAAIDWHVGRALRETGIMKQRAYCDFDVVLGFVKNFHHAVKEGAYRAHTLHSHSNIGREHRQKTFLETITAICFRGHPIVVHMKDAGQSFFRSEVVYPKAGSFLRRRVRMPCVNAVLKLHAGQNWAGGGTHWEPSNLLKDGVTQ
jgi:hypothetical protein